MLWFLYLSKSLQASITTLRLWYELLSLTMSFQLHNIAKSTTLFQIEQGRRLWVVVLDVQHPKISKFYKQMYDHNYSFQSITHVALASSFFYNLQHSDVICDNLHYTYQITCCMIWCKPVKKGKENLAWHQQKLLY